MPSIDSLLKSIKENPEEISFADAIEVIDASYEFTPTGFKNGYMYNEPDQNNGSCKIFAFGKKHDLSAHETLNLFGNYYRVDVVEHPDNDDHQNIRNFIKYGWSEVEFEGEALLLK